MDYTIRIILGILTLWCGWALSEDDCWIPCNNFQDGSCISIQCKTDSRATYECHLISTVMPSYQKLKPLKTCIAPTEVPGMPQFCSTMLSNESLLLENLRKGIPTRPTKPANENEDFTVVAGSDCVPVTILAGVAVGCFTTGCVVTWLFLLILWSKNSAWCCKEPNKEGNLADSNRPQSTSLTVRHEILPARMFSISHQRLLSSTSIDSGMSSSQAVVPVSPPSQSVTAAVPDIRPNTHSGEINDYTRLIRHSAESHTSQEQQATSIENDYASLLASGIQDSSAASQNPYQRLQSSNNIASDQKTSCSQRMADSVPSVCYSSIKYPSMSRSTKSDTHDYDSIFSDNNASGVDYTEYDTRKDSNGDYHDYQECDESTSLERHEYFDLQEQPHEYFILEKDAGKMA